MNNKVFFGLLIVAAGIIVGWYLLGGKPGSFQLSVPKGSSPTPTQAASRGSSGITDFGSGPSSEMEKGGVSARTVITYTDTGFAPSPVTIQKGTTVTFVNESSRGMWVASGVYPTHQLLPGFDELRSVAKGGTYEYTFVKVGTWKYQNDLKPADEGRVIVTE